MRKFSTVFVLLLFVIAIFATPVMGYSYVSVGDVTMTQGSGSDPTKSATLAAVIDENYNLIYVSIDTAGTVQVAGPKIIDQKNGLAIKHYLLNFADTYTPTTPAMSPIARSCI